jgi:hypothetical protein
MTIRERILAALHSGDRLCDDCLSEATGVRPRQTVNAECRRMRASQILARATEDCACPTFRGPLCAERSNRLAFWKYDDLGACPYIAVRSRIWSAAQDVREVHLEDIRPNSIGDHAFIMAAVFRIGRDGMGGVGVYRPSPIQHARMTFASTRSCATH